MENEIGRGHSGRRLEEEEGSGKEGVMKGRTGRTAGGGCLASGEARRGEGQTVSETVAGVRGGGGSSLPSHTHTHTTLARAHARPITVFGVA